MNHSIGGRTALGMVVWVFMIVGACAPQPAPAPAKLIAFPGTPTAACVQYEVLPQIEEVVPETIRPGDEVKVTASGGYLRDNCGAYIEGSRLYKLFFDDEPIADLPCYIHHCESEFVMPEDTEVGRHCMGVQKGTCQIEVDVAGK